MGLRTNITQKDLDRWISLLGIMQLATAAATATAAFSLVTVEGGAEPNANGSAFLTVTPEQQCQHSQKDCV